MPMSRVQFQKCLWLPEFMDRYGIEAQCEQTLIAARWPSGLVCPRCEATSTRTTFRREDLQYRQCANCQYQCERHRVSRRPVGLSQTWLA